MATTPTTIDDALALLRERRLALFEVSRLRNIAMTRQHRAGVPELNAQIAIARAAWLEARAAVQALL